MRFKRLLSIVLVLALVLGSFSVALAVPRRALRKVSYSKDFDRDTNNSIALDPRTNGLKNNEKVRVIVELTDKPVIEYATQKGVKFSKLNSLTVKTITEDLVNSQSMVKSSINESSIKIEYHNSFINVVNGFSGTTTYGEAKMIEKLPGVERVVLANEYSRPEPEMIYSKEIVKVKEAWELGYNGEGMVVSVIDTGIDPSHRDMVLTNNEKAKLSEGDVEAIIDEESLPGRYFTPKVPYGYNYMDNNNEILDLGPEASMHGMHVSGTVGANGDEENGGIKGVAPEAQILGMKVFGNDPGMPSTWGDIIIRAMDDSVKLGADVINMSLGSTAQFVRPNDPEQIAVTRAAENGVVLSVSAGNANRFGSGWGNPYATNPDVGVVGSPGLTAETIQVASIENEFVQIEALESQAGQIPYMATGPYEPIEVFNGPIEYLFAGLGGVPEDFEGINLEGKIALIERGRYNFVDKIMNAQDRGAIGVIVFNHESGGEGFVNMAYPGEGRIPAVFIGRTDGLALKALIDKGENTVEFNGETKVVKNPNDGKMSSFTSWGLTPNLDFKPEITAPGGNIYSTFQDDKYGMMSGTSMAAPHVAGGSALILQRVGEEFDLDGVDKVNMVKNILMSTAKPLIDRGLYNEAYPTGNFVSPRRQGAGVMDLYGAATTPAVVVDSETELSKVNLKEIDDHTTFTVTVENFSDETVAYAVYGTVGTSLSLNGEIHNEAQGVYIDGTIDANKNWAGDFPISFEFDDDTVIKTVYGEVYNTIEIPGGRSVDFDVEIDLSNAVDWMYNAPLDNIFPNGTFIEGFVRLVSADDTAPELSIPYVGFYGDWDEAPILDGSIYDENSFYGATGMLWLEDEINLEDMSEEELFDLIESNGLGMTMEGPDKSKIAFSPNGDGVADTITPLISFLRNARELDINILDTDGNKLLDITSEEYVRKNYHDGLYPITTLHSNWEWNGEVRNKIVDGEYIYQIRAKIDYPGADWHTVEFPVKIDTIEPVIESVDYDTDKEILTVKANDGDNEIKEYELVDSNYEHIDSNTDGVFDLDKLIDDDSRTVLVVVRDYAFNTAKTEEMVVKDHVIPWIELEEPESYERFNSKELLFKGSVMDSSQLLELKIDGQDVDFTLNEETGDYDFETTVVFMEDGQQRVDVEAKDSAGNFINFERVIFVDTNPPVITMTQEPQSRVVDSNIDSVTLSGIVTDNLAQLRVRINGSEVYNKVVGDEYLDQFEQPSEYEIRGYEVALELGKNIIKIDATDSAGNMTVREYIVYRGVDPTSKIETTEGTGTRESYISKETKRINPSGGKVKMFKGEVVLDFAKGTFDDKVSISVEIIDEDDVKLPEPTETTKLMTAENIYKFDSNGANFNKPVSITLKYDADKVENPQRLGIYFYNEETKEWEYIGGKVDTENETIKVELPQFSIYGVMEYYKTFNDIDIPWAKKQIELLASRHIINGVNDISYAPHHKISRAEFAKLLVNALNLKASDNVISFNDIEEGKWYTEAIQTAASLDIVKGYGDSFNPNGEITREAMAVMIIRALKQVDTEGNYTFDDLNFSDAKTISNWSKNEVGIAAEKGLITGVSEADFAPKENATRAQAAVIIYRLLDLLDRM